MTTTTPPDEPASAPPPHSDGELTAMLRYARARLAEEARPEGTGPPGSDWRVAQPLLAADWQALAVLERDHSVAHVRTFVQRYAGRADFPPRWRKAVTRMDREAMWAAAQVEWVSTAAVDRAARAWAGMLPTVPGLAPQEVNHPDAHARRALNAAVDAAAAVIADVYGAVAMVADPYGISSPDVGVQEVFRRAAVALLAAAGLHLLTTPPPVTSRSAEELADGPALGVRPSASAPE